MKRLSSIILFSAALILMLASCSKKQGSCLIPDNAFVVFRLDMTKLLESTGMKGDDATTKKEIEKFIKDAGLPKEAREKLLEIIDDPTSSGIDFTEPFFAYGALTKSSGGFEGGFVGCVASKGNLEETIEKLGGNEGNFSLEEYGNGDVKYMMVDRNAAFIFNGDWFYVGPVEMSDNWEPDVDATIEQLLDRADGKDNIEDNEAFKQMCDRKGLMQIGFFGTGFDGLPGTSEMLSQLPEDCELKDIAGVTDLIINNGEIVMEGEAFLMSDAWKKQAELINYKTIEKSQAKYADAEGALAIVNVDPKGLFNQIRKIAKNAGLSDDDLDKLDELKPVFDAFTGTGMAAINRLNSNGPEVVAYVGTRNSDLLDKLVNEKAANDEIIADGPNKYRLPIDYDFDYNDSIGDWVMMPTKFMQVGWKDKQTYFLINTDEEPFTTPRKPFTDVKGMGIYVYASGELMGEAIRSGEDEYSDGNSEKVAQAVEDIFDYAELYLESPTKGVFRLATNKKDKSPIVFIIDYVKKTFL